jgi:hypothetical protein
MKKILIAVVLVALVWAVPAVRTKVVAAAVPVLERLGPVGDKLLTPSRKYATKNEIIAIARLIANDRTEGRTLPDDRGFNQWLTKRIYREDGIDVWGNRFWMRIRRDSVTVGSNGPDGQRSTGDDVTHTHPL